MPPSVPRSCRSQPRCPCSACCRVNSRRCRRRSSRRPCRGSCSARGHCRRTGGASCPALLGAWSAFSATDASAAAHEHAGRLGFPGAHRAAGLGGMVGTAAFGSRRAFTTAASAGTNVGTHLTVDPGALLIAGLSRQVAWASAPLGAGLAHPCALSRPEQTFGQGMPPATHSPLLSHVSGVWLGPQCLLPGVHMPAQAPAVQSRAAGLLHDPGASDRAPSTTAPTAAQRVAPALHMGAAMSDAGSEPSAARRRRPRGHPLPRHRLFQRTLQRRPDHPFQHFRRRRCSTGCHRCRRERPFVRRWQRS